MSRSKAVAAGVGVLTATLATGALFAPAASATEHSSSAYAISASGLLKIDPLPSVGVSEGFDQKSVAEFSLPGGLFKLNALNAQAGKGFAKASIKDVSLNPGVLIHVDKPLLTASAITADCKDGKASSSLAKASIGGIKLDVAAAPNTTVGVPGLASVTLNKQTKNKNGSVTVTAIEVSVDGIQKLSLASATCATGGDGDGGTPTTEPTKPTKPTDKPTSPGKPSDDKGGDKGKDKPAGDKPDANGKAPTPTPVKAHLDVTG
ncbi:choice-of-anchor P family protein [Amycolatopsis anabasis]|uniref:choice-of-anchor P family protein n=1 Tax=Amycolatopsis anabasis TaxID=1840409 RepID=UPI00131CFE5F|nr:choice-of-anchor P family protein [Amycolatopsis anabasis]